MMAEKALAYILNILFISFTLDFNVKLACRYVLCIFYLILVCILS